MFKLKKIKKFIIAWENNTCPCIEKCKKEGKYNKKYNHFPNILKDCPKRCLEDDWDYLDNIRTILNIKGD